MAAAIIELDPLPDPVRPAAQDHNLFPPAGARLAFHIAHRGGLVGRIHVGRLRLELGGAGIDPLEHRLNAQIGAGAAQLRLVAARQTGKPRIGEAHHLQPPEPGFRDRQAIAPQRLFGRDDLADAGQKPWVDPGDRMDAVVVEPMPHRLGDQP
jgi:hypothetical protein